MLMINRLFTLALVVASALALGVPPADASSGGRAPGAEHATFVQEGMASWYGKGFVGHKTASGERFDARAMSAAHRTLPLGTIVRVTNLRNGRTVEVRINDRGPVNRAKTRRILDLSKSAATALGMADAGIAKIRIVALASDQRGS
jgi:rare lipoprotein A (peptidoglycan hydrolase)